MFEFIKTLLSDYIALIGALTAIIVSVFSFIESKRKSVLTSISSNRIIWISDLRNEVHEFLKEYLKREENNEYTLRIIRAKIELYVRNSKMYNDFLEQLEKCTLEPFTENDYKKLVIEAQIILNDAWRRMKREAGIPYKSDKRLTSKIEKEKNKKVVNK